MPPPGLRPSRGFTLIELLVVITVIALVLGLLLPTLAGARLSAQVTKCAVHARTVAHSLLAYSDDHREYLPHWSAWQTYHGDGATNEDTPGPGWAELLEPHVGTMDTFLCPVRREPSIQVAYFLQSRYTALMTGGQFYKSLGRAAVMLPSQFVLTGDATNPYLFASPYGGPHLVPNVDPDDAREPATLYAGESSGSRQPHAGGASNASGARAGSNIGFFDGHVQVFTTADPQKMTWHGRMMKLWDDVR